jgi:hypothetical protein
MDVIRTWTTGCIPSRVLCNACFRCWLPDCVMHIHAMNILAEWLTVVSPAMQMAYRGENSQTILIQSAQIGLNTTANAVANYNNFKQSAVDYTTYYYCSFTVGSDKLVDAYRLPIIHSRI